MIKIIIDCLLKELCEHFPNYRLYARDNYIHGWTTTPGYDSMIRLSFLVDGVEFTLFGEYNQKKQFFYYCDPQFIDNLMAMVVKFQ